MSQEEEKKTRRTSRYQRYKERRITQIKELKTLVWGLDLDEGIRFVGNVPGFEDGAFVFLTKSDNQYCVVARDRVMDENLKQFVPGGKEQCKYFETPESAWAYVSRFLSTPLEAYYY